MFHRKRQKWRGGDEWEILNHNPREIKSVAFFMGPVFILPFKNPLLIPISWSITDPLDNICSAKHTHLYPSSICWYSQLTFPRVTSLIFSCRVKSSKEQTKIFCWRGKESCAPSLLKVILLPSTSEITWDMWIRPTRLGTSDSEGNLPKK